MGQEVKWKLVQLKGSWYAREVGGKRQVKTLNTKNKETAKVKFRKSFGSEVLPEENNKHLSLGKAHLNLVNPLLTQYTFGDLYEKWINHRGNAKTRERKKRDSERGILALLKERKLCDYSTEGMISGAAPELPITTRKQLGALQRLAYKLGWIMMNFVQPIHLEQGKREKRKTRAISDEEFEEPVSYTHLTLPTKA